MSGIVSFKRSLRKIFSELSEQEQQTARAANRRIEDGHSRTIMLIIPSIQCVPSLHICR